MEGWKKALAYASGASVVAAVLYYLLREEPEALPGKGGSGSGEGDDKKKALKVEEVTREQVVQILNEMVASQERMRVHMKDLTRTLIEKDVDFEETYEKVCSVQPEDPLDSHGLSMPDFDQLLSKYQQDPQVMEGITRIMGQLDPTSKSAANTKTVKVSKVIEVHAFMLSELEGVLRLFASMKGKRAWDMKAVISTAQAIVGAKVEKSFGLTSEEIERAVIHNHSSLAMSQEFADINMKMQQTMHSLSSLMGP